MKVLCDKKSGNCPKTCNHSVPHEPIFDNYDDNYGSDGMCTEMRSRCGWRIHQPLCICKKVNGTHEEDV